MLVSQSVYRWPVMISACVLPHICINAHAYINLHNPHHTSHIERDKQNMKFQILFNFAARIHRKPDVLFSTEVHFANKQGKHTLKTSLDYIWHYRTLISYLDNGIAMKWKHWFLSLVYHMYNWRAKKCTTICEWWEQNNVSNTD